MSAGTRNALLALFLAASTSGCITGTWTEWRTLAEPADLELLTVGESDLTRCLEVLGAPLRVSELGDGAVLAWGWAQEGSWGLSASVPVGDLDPSFSYQSSIRGLAGVVLFFDADWMLTRVRLGRLAEVLPPGQERAQAVD